GGVFAQAGMSSTLLLPEQAASSAARMDMTIMRTMTAVLAIGCPPMRTNEGSRTFELRQTLRSATAARVKRSDCRPCASLLIPNNAGEAQSSRPNGADRGSCGLAPLVG